MWCFEYPDLDIDIKNYFYQMFTTCSAQIGRKTKSAQDLLKFGTCDISNIAISILMSKIIFYQIFTSCYSQIGSKLKNAQNLLRFGRTDIWNMPISVLMSIMIFIKYLPPVRLKLVQN